MKSVVPQGGHCSPLLFSLFVNDLKDCVEHCEFLMFAVDLKLFSRVRNVTDINFLQTDLDNLSEWCNKNLLDLNVDKFFKISFSKRKNMIPSSYSINCQLLNSGKLAKDLGVLFDSHLSFVEHINQLVVKSQRILGFILRNCEM